MSAQKMLREPKLSKDLSDGQIPAESLMAG
jgi:hypothetical protein